MENEDLIALTADITSAFVSNNQIAADDVGKLVQDIHQALASLGEEPEEEAAAYEPAVSVRSSIKPDHLVCLECGSHQKTLKRHLRVAHDLTPGGYRERYGLRSDYPMTSPEYSARRGEMAKAIGLGRDSSVKRGRKSSKNAAKQVSNGK